MQLLVPLPACLWLCCRTRAGDSLLPLGEGTTELVGISPFWFPLARVLYPREVASCHSLPALPACNGTGLTMSPHVGTEA